MRNKLISCLSTIWFRHEVIISIKQKVVVTLRYKKPPWKGPTWEEKQPNYIEIFRLTSVKFMFLLLKIFFSREGESDWYMVPNEEDCSLFPSAFGKLSKPLLERWDFWTPLCSQQKSKVMCEGELLKLLFRFYICFLNFMLKLGSFLLRKKQLVLLKIAMPSFCIHLLGSLNSIARLLEDWGIF